MVLIVKIKRILTNMKRLFGIASIVGLLSILSVYPSFAYTHPPVPKFSAHRSSQPSPVQSDKHDSKNAAHEAARIELNLEMKQAQNGRDLAFADANATLLQSLQLAGKDKGAKQAARGTFKLAAKEISTAYKQAVATAEQKYRAAIAVKK